MLVKLALRNVRRSARDYALYFVTVALGVAVFYAFNTVNDQAVLLDALSAGSLRMLALLNMMLRLLSGVVVCVLGFLVVYANRFLIRRRRREFGTYLVLGMSAWRVSRVLLYETMMVGLASLMVGLGLGLALSQVLSFATAALMGSTMTKYHFVASPDAALFTIACFAAIFIVSALIGILYVRRCRLVSLLSVHQANEGRVKVNMRVRALAFAASLVVMGCAYWQLAVNGMLEIDAHFAAATVLMIFGTFLFFWGVAGFAVALLQRFPRVYFRGLSCFTTRQLSSKINTAFASMSVVSIMLFFALTISSVGMGLVELFTGNVEDISSYDMSIQAQPLLIGRLADADEDASLYERYDGDMAACFEGEGAAHAAGAADAADAADASAGAGGAGADGAAAGANASVALRWDDVAEKTAQVDYYLVEGETPYLANGETPMNVLMYSDLFEQVPAVDEAVDESLRDSADHIPVQVMGVSQYNDLCALTGRRGVMLEDDQCAVNNLLASTDDVAQALCDERVSLTVAGAQLHFSGQVQHVPVRNGAMVDVVLEVIVPDYVIDAMKAVGAVPCMSVLDVMYRGDRVQGDALFERYAYQAFPPSEEEGGAASSLISTSGEQTFRHGTWPCFQSASGREMADQATGFRMLVTYLAVYIGFVLIIATAAILAIQQLSETADSLERYRRLRDLGADERQVCRSLRTQTVLYFVAPLFLALCHTACAVLVISGVLFAELGVSMLGSVVLACGIVVAVYGLYLAITYALTRSIVSA